MTRLINDGREWVIDAIKFDPERTEVHYHPSEDDVLVGGTATMVSTIYMRLIMNDLITEEIADIQDAAVDLVRKSLQWEHRVKKLQLEDESIGTGQEDEDD